jgi:DNA-directed RNA polymerase subunit RPC12/RpoP
MKLVDISSHTLEIPCPHCAHKIGKTIRELKALDQLICGRCGTVSNLDKAQVAREVAGLERQVNTQINKAAADLKRTLGRLGK